MSDKIMQIPIAELMQALEDGYKDYKKSIEDDTGAEDLAHVKGYCTTLEQILAAYGDVSAVEMMEIKNPIIGNVSLRRKKKIDYDIPTIFRK